MSTKKKNRIVQPYLFFNGRCEEALDFYRKAIGAGVNALVRVKGQPGPENVRTWDRRENHACKFADW
jgi:uncharacterized glyoxalase superfamily protein PhnB